ncbi:leucine-rich repeat and immunoglobulin-like domain-containing nogo receptor-interacting protein 3 [Octopus bimaculoides]|uniref:LRRNT domain-containing protein n=1 Tax=Octopus bimaculoides TaxID=37653 RepID=A0A0L8GKC4_OCTBM|nr:leucine-rich repeat and immunoglobulin-like domain-containing nogo receptor-interacting protein 3 [Octopus bimaculoides]|eukprot:XP_014780238.1 PREDICTED: leucine-rich repeat and immunoglobulin-like domain-containing nogo receptor-interacting protein 3 [Octopus bimaculoides]
MPEYMFRHILSYKQTFVLILYTILVLEVHAGADICTKCSCKSNGNVDCGSRQLTSVPQPIPPTVENLNLRQNQIKTLPQGVFQNHPSLQKIDLRNNQITTMSHGAFENLPNLKSL